MTALEQRPPTTRISRRAFLRSAALGGAGLLGASLLGCGDNGGAGNGTPEPSASATLAGIATISAPNMRWLKLSPAGTLPPVRYEHSLVTDGAKLYLFAGRGADAMADLWVFDIATSTWANVDAANGPAARFGHNAIWDPTRSKLVIFGGQDGTTFFNDIWEFDPAANTWNDPLALFDPVSADALPVARYSAGACLDDEGHLLVTHGQAPGGLLDDTWQFDLASSTWTDVSPAAGAKRPSKRYLVHGAWDTLKRRLLIYGGQQDQPPYLDDLWGWSPEFGWQQIARLPRPTPRAQYAMVYNNDRTAGTLIGGHSADGLVNDTWVYNADGENWSQAAPVGELITARYGHDTAIAPDGAIYVFGGNDATGALNDLWRLDIIP